VDPSSDRWTQVTPSAFAWERASLDYVRRNLPDADPWRAWANFEIVDDRGVAEVDLMVLSPWGLWVIEIKSRPGKISGDAHTWTWRRPNGRDFADDNPLIGCDRKAKRIKSLLQRTHQVPPAQLPFLTPLVFLHADPLEIRLGPTGRKGVVAEDGPLPSPEAMPTPREDGIPGILQALAGADPSFRKTPRRIDAVLARQVAAAVARVGIRESNRAKRVGNYELVKGPIGEGTGWQDFEARHLHVERVRRRVRIWSTQSARTVDERATRARAAEREFRALDGISHPAILGVVDYVPDAERGPSVVFEHDSSDRRLDLWLAEHHERLDLATRLALLRDIADAVRYAHQRRLHHRALTPRSVLVARPESDHPLPRIFNWQTADRQGTAGGTALGPVVTATEHVGDLVDADAGGYLAPELFTTVDADGVTLDVFSLGTIAYLVLTGKAPADSPAELLARLRQDRGLLLSSVIDGVHEHLEAAVQLATAPAVADRLQAVDELLDRLATAEAALAGGSGAVVDPLDAGPGDLLEGGWTVVRPLGRGSSATALLVEGDTGTAVLKVALDADQDRRIRQEHEALERLRHPAIVATRGTAVVSGRSSVILEFAGERSLAALLRDQGRIGIDLLQRFGTDLLEAVRELEAAGIAHRDIKPDNLGVAPRGVNDELHLVLFDFSLTKTPPENIRAGTPPYLDPFLAQRSSPAWDVAAERWAAAVTLYEMAAGTTPVFGDGRSDPAAIDDEVTIDDDLLDPALVRSLGEFFRNALRRDHARRFADAGEMLRAWHRAFEHVDEPVLPITTDDGEPSGQLADDRRERALVIPEGATRDSRLAELGMTSRLLSAAERLGATTVSELLGIPIAQINRLRGVGNRTRRLLVDWRRSLEERFPTMGTEDADVAAGRSVDALLAGLLPRGTASLMPEIRTLRLLLGIDPLPTDAERRPDEWPSTQDVAVPAGVEPSAVSAHLDSARQRWANRNPGITSLRNDLAELLASQGGVMSAEEVAASVLAVRGSERVGMQRAQVAAAVVRAAVETEAATKAPRWASRRIGRRGRRVIVALEGPDTPIDQTIAWVGALGAKADELADREPLLAGTDLVETLRSAVPAGTAADLPDSRLVSLAAAASDGAAASARLELYPRGMDPARAVRRGQGSLLGPQSLTVDEVHRRIHSRFPEAAPLPGRPELDRFLVDAGLPLTWQDSYAAYRFPEPTLAGLSTGTVIPARTRSGTPGASAPGEETLQFDRTLTRTLEDGGFLAVTVPVALASAATAAMTRRGAVALDLDRLLIRSLRDEATRRRIPDFGTVLAADRQGDGTAEAVKLRQLVNGVVDGLEAELRSAGPVVLLTGLGLLARYRHLGILERLRDEAGAAGAGVRTAWAVVPMDGDGPPVLDGHPVPVLAPSQWAALPAAWLTEAAKPPSAA
jgi:serine/threonine protein kinase